MIAFTIDVEIAAPIEEVFAFLANFENMSAWNYAVLRADQLTLGPSDVGAQFRLTRATDEQNFTITALDAPRLVQATSTQPTSPSLMMQFDLEPSATGTRVRDTWNLDVGGSVLEHVGAYGVRRAVAANLHKLKQLLETGQTILQDGRVSTRAHGAGSTLGRSES